MQPDSQRFWRQVARGEPGDCWRWLGGTRKGYGRFKLKGRMVTAHRHAYELEVGPIPDGLFVLHECDNPSCVNPRHLFLGTQLDNIRDRDKKGRHVACHGERHGEAKLTEV